MWYNEADLIHERLVMAAYWAYSSDSYGLLRKTIDLFEKMSHQTTFEGK